MLSLSQTTGYAIVALSRLEPPEGSPILVRDLAAQTGLSPFYLAKIVIKLAKARLILSRRGHSGGILLARPAAAISLLDISEALDGSAWLSRCLLGLESCTDERACPTHALWKPTREKVRKHLASTSLADVQHFERERAQTWSMQLLD